LGGNRPIGSFGMKKLLFLVLIVSLGVVAARRLRDA
jgi:hypothetical protein